MNLTKFLSNFKLWNRQILSLNDFYEFSNSQLITWCAFAANQDFERAKTQSKVIELVLESNSFKIRFSPIKNLLYYTINAHNRIYSNAVEIQIESSLINNSIDKIINQQIINLQSRIKDRQNLNVAIKNTDLNSELKALEWIQVSLRVLEKAIIESLTNSDLLFQCKLFIGLNPQLKNHEIRFIIFNLDISYTFLEDGSLQVEIFDDKNNQFGTSKKPSLRGNYQLKKFEMLDEIVKIISLAASGFKIY